MKRSAILVSTLTLVLALTPVLVTGCSCLEETSGGTLATEVTASAAEGTDPQSTTSLDAATSDSTATTSTTVAPASTTTVDGGGGSIFEMGPAILEATVDQNMFVTPTRYEEDHANLVWNGRWYTGTGSSFSGGAQKWSTDEECWVVLVFEGTGVRLVTTAGPLGGKLTAVLNGEGLSEAETLDLHSEVGHTQQNVWYSGYLADGSYTVRFEWDPGNEDDMHVWIDAFDVWE